jgi:choline dehydrogenase-like flavoprotein
MTTGNNGPRTQTMNADVIVVGAGLAGLVATAELADAGKRVLLLDQEPEQNLGGQAFWSLGGLFLVDTPEQRSTPRACGGSRSSDGPNAGGISPRATATPCRGST